MTITIFLFWTWTSRNLSIHKEENLLNVGGAGFAGRLVLGFEDLSIDVFLEAQNQKHNEILYLIDIAFMAVVSGEKV